MKTIFRHLNTGLLLAAVLALGAVAGFAQDPCADTAGIAALDAKFRENYDKDLAKRKIAVEAGKQYIEKYAACAPSKEFVDYLNSYLPGMEKAIKDEEEKVAMASVLKKFNDGLTAKNWNDVYAAGKEILAKQPDEYRDAVLVLGSIGLDETAKTPRVTTWNDDTLKFAKMAIADLEANKTFKSYGVAPFKYKNKEDALGWMNYTVGYITFFDKNDKKGGLSYLYKATQVNSDTKSNPVVYESIGAYYFDDVRRLAKEIQDLAAKQSPENTEEQATQLVNEIKGKVGLVNGTAEAAIDAYARAYTFAKKDPKTPKAYTDSLYKNLQDLYKVRFNKTDGFDAYIASTVNKPMPNPLNPITPINDAEPSTAASSGSVTPEPATTTPAAKPSGSKPAAVAKRPIKRRG
jgi:hypothetical protein